MGAFRTKLREVPSVAAGPPGASCRSWARAPTSLSGPRPMSSTLRFGRAAGPRTGKEGNDLEEDGTHQNRANEGRGRWAAPCLETGPSVRHGRTSVGYLLNF